MATALELCTQLGFLDDPDEEQSRGTPKALLDDIKAFMIDHQDERDAEKLACRYLRTSGRGEKYWHSAEALGLVPRKTPILGPHLGWLVDQDFIEELVIALFDLRMKSRIIGPVIIDLEDVEYVVSEHHQDVTMGEPSQLMATQLTGPITRLSSREPTMISSLVAAGFTEPFPITTSNEEDLIRMLKSWMQSHPSQQLPGSVNFKKQYCGRSAKELTFGATSEHVWVERVRISASCIGYFLMDDDGSCMLVSPNYTNNNGWRGYHGWLGADLGFTLQTIARTGAVAKWQFGSLVEEVSINGSVDPELLQASCSSFAQEPDIGNAKSKETGTAKIKRQVIIKKEPTRTEIRQAAMRRSQLHQQRRGEEERWRFETPPLSSLDLVKKRRWPPQYVSPPPVSKHQKSLRCRNKVPKASKKSVSQRSQYQGSPSLGLISVGPALPVPRDRTSYDLNGQDLESFKTPSLTQLRKHTTVSPLTPISPRSSAFSFASSPNSIRDSVPRRAADSSNPVQ